MTDELSNSLETGVKTKKITTDEARLCFEEMYKIGKKEKIDNLYYTAENELESLKRKIDRNNNILEDKEIQKKQKLPNENFLQLYFEKGIDIKQVNEVKKNIRNELIYTSEKNKGQER